MTVTLGNEEKCEDFRRQYLKYDYLWKNDLQVRPAGGKGAGRGSRRVAAAGVCVGLGGRQQLWK